MTDQMPDIIQYEDKIYKLYSEPLKPYLRSIDIGNTGDLSNCWRGYVAHWEIVSGSLNLTAIKTVCSEKDLSISALFNMMEAPIKAIWYSGELWLGDGTASKARWPFPKIVKKIAINKGDM